LIQHFLKQFWFWKMEQKN